MVSIVCSNGMFIRKISRLERLQPGCRYVYIGEWRIWYCPVSECFLRMLLVAFLHVLLQIWCLALKSSSVTYRFCLCLWVIRSNSVGVSLCLGRTQATVRISGGVILILTVMTSITVVAGYG